MKRAYKDNLGFTLLELCMVLVVLSLLLSGWLSVATQKTRVNKQTELKMKMDAIESALLEFRKNNNRMPCPADLTILVTDATGYFGAESLPVGDCTNSQTYSNGWRTTNTIPPAANGYASNTALGGVPVRAIGLSDDYAFDPWGGRFTYAVDRRTTGTNMLRTPMIIINNAPSVLTYGPSNTGIGSITVYGGSGLTLTSNAVAVVLSHGQNGHGGYQAGGARKPTGSSNSWEQVNCHCSSIAATGTFTPYFYQYVATGTQGLDSYDDVTRFYTRGSLLTSSEELTEK